MYRISTLSDEVDGEVTLPGSKSISNRILIVNALCNKSFEIENLSDADDVVNLKKALETSKKIIQVGEGATCMRFLIAYFSISNTEKILRGSRSLEARPIGEVVSAMRMLGADIDYLGKEGYPPVRIKGKQLEGGSVNVRASESSQYISAILLVAPYLRKGIEIQLGGQVVSRPYINMTLEIMRQFGIGATVKDGLIQIPSAVYKPVRYTVEADWSGASYWYLTVALAGKGQLKISKLTDSSLQGDARIIDFFAPFGVVTKDVGDGIVLTKMKKKIAAFMMVNVQDYPDISMNLMVAASFMKIKMKLSGIGHLAIKESDRIRAMTQQLAKFNVAVDRLNENELYLDGTKFIVPQNASIDTYQDHRIAMVFAPTALKAGRIGIVQPGVVSKSYPSFWVEMGKIGFNIEKE